MNLIQKLNSMFSPMLSCKKVNQFIIDYLEDELPQDVRTKFEAHIQKCENCNTYLEQYKHTLTIVRTDGRLDVPEDLTEMTLQFLRDHLSSN